MLAPLNLISFWEIKSSTISCMRCTWCDHTCPPNGVPSTRIGKGVSPSRVPECILCYECQKVCPMAEEVDLKKHRRVSRTERVWPS
jgi:Fe-S-cluster-containing hydrogenase component 2